MPLNIHTPGLMFGLAGIGYGLLRLAEPDSVPVVPTLRCLAARVIM
jgi:lantibiotic modifying enzyme